MATKLGKILADFSTNLATAIVVGGTTASLQSATDDDGVALPTGRYFFTLDGGNSSKEHISCDLNGTSLTNIKSVSRQGAETAGVVRTHRIGATVTLTDFAHIKFMNDLLSGATTLDSTAPLGYDGAPSITTGNQLAAKTYVDTGDALDVQKAGAQTITGVKTFTSTAKAKYDVHPTFTADEEIIDKKYADDLAIAGSPNASTTVKGIVEEATQAEMDAMTPAGATGARLFVNPSLIRTTTLTAHPLPNYVSNLELATLDAWTGNTTGFTSSFNLRQGITLNKIHFYIDTVTAAGTIKIGIFSEDGQTRYCNETSASISATGLNTHTMSAPLTLPAGNYYLVIVPVTTTNVTALGYQVHNLATAALNNPASEPVLMGTQAVAAGTLPATFNPVSGITASAKLLPDLRFDN